MINVRRHIDDNMHRITAKKQHITQKNVQFDGTLNAGYDLAYTYGTSAGRLTVIQDATGTIWYKYGNMGEIVTEKREHILPNGNLIYAGTRYSCDSWGRTLSITYPDGERIDYGYNKTGLLNSVVSDRNGTLTNKIVYNKMEQKISAYTHQNRTEYIYDTVMWRLKEHRLYDAGGSMIKSEEFDYNSVGNIVNQKNYYNFGYKIYEFMQEYRYDRDNRLTEAYAGTSNDSPYYDVRFRYSPAGRIIDKALKLTAVKNHQGIQTSYMNLYNYKRDNPYAATAIGNEALCWDEAGNLSTVAHNNKPKELMGWTVDSRMDSYFNMEEGTAAVYRYDASGKRDMKLTGKIANVYNMGKLVRHTVFYDATLYMGNLMTIDKTGYKKHYFIEGERFMTSIGGDGRGVAGCFVRMKIPESGVTTTNGWLKNTLARNNFGECSDEKYIFEPYAKDLSYFYGDFFARMPVTKDLLYYHHSDRLGSGSVITSHQSGNPVHMLAYIPYGETLLDLSDSTGYQMPHQFAGYEKDQESGLSYAGARYYNAKYSIFTSVDRFALKYPWQSPYCYAGDNPIANIDVNGDSLWIKNGKEMLLYNNGSLYNKDGSNFTGEQTRFTKKVMSALEEIVSADDGNAALSELQKSKNNFVIKRTFKRSYIDYGYIDDINYIKASANMQYELGFTKTKIEGGGGATIFWNTSGELLMTTKGELRNSTTDLGHELFHALDANRGMVDVRGYNGASRAEWQASYRENVLRKQLDLPLRTYYDKTFILTPDNQPLRPSWYKH